VWQPLCVCAIDDHPPYTCPERRLEAVAQARHAAQSLFVLAPPNLKRLVHSRNQRHRLRPRPQAALLKTTQQQRLQLDVAAHEQAANAPWPVKFVRRESQRGGAECRKIDRQFSDDLNRIGVNRNPARIAEKRHVRDGLHNAGLVIPKHHRNDRALALAIRS
jgi:hypothetical protein